MSSAQLTQHSAPSPPRPATPPPRPRPPLALRTPPSLSGAPRPKQEHLDLDHCLRLQRLCHLLLTTVSMVTAVSMLAPLSVMAPVPVLELPCCRPLGCRRRRCSLIRNLSHMPVPPAHDDAEVNSQQDQYDLKRHGEYTQSGNRFHQHDLKTTIR